MKSYKIEFNGKGSEIVVGVLTEEQVKIIDDTIEEKDFDSPVEFFQDSELLEKHGIPEWSQNDMYYHKYGPHYFDSTIKVTNENGEVILESDVEDIEFNEEIEAVEFDEKYYTVMGYDYKPIIASTLEDNGLSFNTTIEIEDDEEFDINKLRLFVDTVQVEFDEYTDIISRIEYNGQKLDSDGEDTQNESFNITIYKQN